MDKRPLSLRFVHHIERYLYHCQPTFFDEKSLVDLIPEAKEMSLASYAASDLAAVDFAINFSEELLDDKFLCQPKLGVWSIYMGDTEKVSSQLIGVNDFITENDVVSLGLQIETRSDQSNITVLESQASIEIASLCRTAEQCLHKTAQFIPRYLRQLSLANTSNQLGFTAHKTLKRTLSVYESARLLWQGVKRFTHKMDHKYLAQEQWALMYAGNAKGEKQIANFDLASFKMLTPPKDRFWADPFIVEEGGKNYVFFEELLFSRDLGYLCCMELQADGTHTNPVKILEKPYHLSYPFVFEYQNQYYMIPETGDQQCITLYKCSNFPYQWEFEKELLAGIRAYDSTLFEHEGRWWIFACIADDKDSSTTEDLHLFYADSPLSQAWQAHPQNPVVSDAASARPAGKVFVHEGTIYRPSQNCARSYGAGLNLCEIKVLTTDEYSEERVSQVFPQWEKRLKGLHTFNFNNNITVSDVIVDQR